MKMYLESCFVYNYCVNASTKETVDATKLIQFFVLFSLKVPEAPGTCVPSILNELSQNLKYYPREA